MAECMAKSQKLYEYYCNKINNVDPIIHRGVIQNIIGLIIESHGPSVSLGDLCYISPNNKSKYGKAEVVGFKNNHVLLMPLHDINGYHPGSKVVASKKTLSIPVGDDLLGRVINGLGEPIDGKGPVFTEESRSIYQDPPKPLLRQPIKNVISTGVKSIDAFTTVGMGQRMGIFAGSGVGKSVLLGMIARNTSADINVIALIGERGREVREFIERDLGEEGLSRSVVVIATSDETPLVRVKAALTATTIAEYFRDKNKNIMFMMDSMTRVAMAQREIGLAIGEPPTTKGYTPSTFALLPKLLERAGNSEHGSITGLYTVLVEGDDMNDPVADAARSILDGHIVLDRELANRGHYPAVDPLQSVSRVMPQVVDDEHLIFSRKILQHLAIYKDAEDLINIGAYSKGSNPSIDQAILYNGPIIRFLKQNVKDTLSFEEIVTQMKKTLQAEKVENK
jgi:flagellum-specific ATP synthase